MSTFSNVRVCVWLWIGWTYHEQLLCYSNSVWIRKSITNFTRNSIEEMKIVSLIVFKSRWIKHCEFKNYYIGTEEKKLLNECKSNLLSEYFLGVWLSSNFFVWNNIPFVLANKHITHIAVDIKSHSSTVTSHFDIIILVIINAW